jgi:hypothetical protein
LQRRSDSESKDPIPKSSSLYVTHKTVTDYTKELVSVMNMVYEATKVPPKNEKAPMKVSPPKKPKIMGQLKQSIRHAVGTKLNQ